MEKSYSTEWVSAILLGVTAAILHSPIMDRQVKIGRVTIVLKLKNAVRSLRSQVLSSRLSDLSNLRGLAVGDRPRPYPLS
jgi:hypothetical protein